MNKIERLALILLFVATPTYSFGQGKARSWSNPVQSGPVLEREVYNPNIELDSTKIDRLIMTAFSSTEVPGGVSLSFDSGGSILYNFKPTSMSLRDVLNSIIAAAPDYEWREDNGVINLHPINDYSLLDTRIAEFNVEKATKGRLLDALKGSTEFKEALAKNHLSEPPFEYCCGLSSPVPPNLYSVHLKDATVREILNEIVRQNGRSTWLYREYTSDTFKDNPSGKFGANKRYYSLYFLIDHF